MRLHRNAKTTPQMRQLIIEPDSSRAGRSVRWLRRLGISVRTVAEVARPSAGRDAALHDSSSRPIRQPRRLSVARQPRFWPCGTPAQRRGKSARPWGFRGRRSRGSCAAPGWDGCAPSSRRPWSSATSGPTSAICCTWISSRWAGFGASGIGSPAIGRRPRRAAAGNTCTWPSTMRPAWPMSRCGARNAAMPAPGFSAAPCSGLPGAGFGSGACSPTTATGIARGSCAGLRGVGRPPQRTRPYTPRTNGKAERFIQTLLREWAYRWPYLSSDTRTAALTGYLHFYNRQRPHASLGRQAPWTRFQEAA